MHRVFRTGMLQKRAGKVGEAGGGWLSFSRVLSISGTFANRTSRMSLIGFFAPNKQWTECVCLCCCLLRSLSTPADQKGIRQLPCPNNAFNLGYVCLAIVWLPHVGSDDNKVGAQFSPNGFSALRSRRSGCLPPAADRPLPPACPSGHDRRAGSLRAQPGNIGRISFLSVPSGDTWRPPHVFPRGDRVSAVPPALLQKST